MHTLPPTHLPIQLQHSLAVISKMCGESPSTSGHQHECCGPAEIVLVCISAPTAPPPLPPAQHSTTSLHNPRALSKCVQGLSQCLAAITAAVDRRKLCERTFLRSRPHLHSHQPNTPPHHFATSMHSPNVRRGYLNVLAVPGTPRDSQWRHGLVFSCGGGSYIIM